MTAPRASLRQETIAIVAVGLTLFGSVLYINDQSADRIETRIDSVESRLDSMDGRIGSVESRMDALLAEMRADRRTFQSAMDDFRNEMMRLAERQSRLEGFQEAQAAATAAGS